MSEPPFEQLANDVADALRAVADTATIVVDLPARRVSVTHGGVLREVALGNAYEEYVRAAPSERAGIVAKYAGGVIGEIGPPPVTAWERLLPKVSPRRERELLRLRFGKKLTNLVGGELIAGGLQLELAFDLPDTIRAVTASDLASICMTEAQAFEVAKQNLRARGRDKAWKPVGPGLWHSPWVDCFDGARLALPELFTGVVRGDPIVVIPNRSSLLLTGSDEPDGLARLYKAVRELSQIDRPVFLTPLRLDDGRWRALDERDAELLAQHPDVMMLPALQAVQDHAVLGPGLAEVLRGRGFETARLEYIDHPDAWLMTVTQLTAAPLAVPLADLAIIGSVKLIWGELVQLLGPDLVPIADLWPRHHELRRFPTDAEVAAVLAKRPPAP